ncbi:MAG: hypothetical protein HYS02_00470, partial [Candidatus Staskawiczbacteria bacterium]|nr:hypothetical protein [Candidatus Staskawiczbacteria bacterium]
KEGLFDKDEAFQDGRQVLNFDERLASAVSEFQEKYASEILAPYGLKRGTGYVGPSTRKKLNTLYGCKTNSVLPVVHITANNSEGPIVTVTPGSSVVIGWNSTIENTKGCTISSDPYNENVNGIVHSSGILSLIPTFNATYTVACTYYDPAIEVSNSVTVNLYSTQPSIISITPNPVTVSTSVGAVLTISGLNFNTQANNDIILKNTSTGVITHFYDISDDDGKTLFFIVPAGTVAGPYQVNVDNNINVATTPAYPITIISSSTQPSITVLSPNGGEMWIQGKTYNITWQSTGVSAVSIGIENAVGEDHSLNPSGQIPASSGSFLYTVPLTMPVGAYKISIQSCLLANIIDRSDNYFSIVAPTTQPSITVDKPNGTEIYQAGSSAVNYAWSANYTVPNGIIKIFVLDSAGNTFYTYGLSYNVNLPPGTYTPGSAGGFLMDGKTFTSGKYRIEVCDMNSPGSVCGFSAYFTVSDGTNVPKITVLSPNGGEQWDRNKQQNITWTFSGNVYSQVDILLAAYTDLGIVQDWQLISAGVSTNQGYYYWTPSSLSFTNASLANPYIGYKIKIREANDNESAVMDTSDNYFSIVSSTQPSITVLSPNGGETLKQGQTYNITWSSVGSSGSSMVNILLINPGGTPTTVASSISTTTGSYTWTVPSNISPASNYKIFVYDPNYATTIFDLSDNYFSIVAPTTSQNISDQSLASISEATARIAKIIGEMLKK